MFLRLSLALVFFFCGFGPVFSRPARENPEPGQSLQSEDTAKQPEQAPQTPLPRLRLTALPEKLRPGEPLTVGYAPEAADPDSLRAVLLSVQGRRLSGASFFTLPGTPVKAAVLAVPSTAAPGNARIQVEGDDRILGEITITIENRDFVSEEIPLNQANTNLRTLPDPQKTAESEYLSSLLFRTGRDIYASGPFVPPVSSTRRTSFFGDRRVYRYTDGSTGTSIHAGIDYGVPTGTEVRACAAGKVILARPRIVTGNSVIIEHFPGVYSIYYHLDKIRVEEGALINAGTALGESGSTGLATGPHLHWEIRVSGENTDPDAFVTRFVLDKEAILRKMNFE
jgi:murein DD-endopeptidase MepM/ murein hydrolase activator NlpD